jgi:hypothetical protein
VLDGCVEEVGGYHVGYDIKLSSTESPRSVTGLEGVRVRVLFAWVPITGVEAVDGEVTVHIGPIRKSFPAVGFKSSPRCIIRLEAVDILPFFGRTIVKPYFFLHQRSMPIAMSLFIT